MQWQTGSDSVLEPAQIDHAIYTLMKKFVQQNRLMKAPGHKQNATNVGLWKLQRQEFVLIPDFSGKRKFFRKFIETRWKIPRYIRSDVSHVGQRSILS
jgi:hypothetical protein